MNQYTKFFLKTHFIELILSIPKTVYFNFKVLPIKNAIKLPYIVSYHVRLRGVNKKTFLTMTDNLTTFSMRIGFGDSVTARRESSRSLICIESGGVVKVGKNLGLSQGCVLYVNNATLALGDKFRCNYSTTIDCSDSNIEIGDNVVLGWNTTIKNNDGHYIIENGRDSIISKKIIIEDHVWLCANSTVLKGTCIKKDSVLAYGALLTKTIDQENILYGGVPARMIKNNINWRE